MVRFIFLFFVLFLSPILAITQESDSWYWAWSRQNQELYAYSPEGRTYKLLDNVVGWQQNIWRINSSQAIALIRTTESFLLYSLEGESIKAFSLNLDREFFDMLVDVGSGLRFEAYRPPYMILTTWESLDKTASKPVLVINLSTKSVELLDDVMYSCCRFTQDNIHLRYTTRYENDDTQTIELIDYNLETNTKQVLFTHTGKGLSLIGDTYGERWLLYEIEREHNFASTSIFNVADSSLELIYERDPSELYTTYGFMGEDLISYENLCNNNCRLRLRTIEGNSFSYRLPNLLDGTSVTSFYPSTKDHLILSRYLDYYFLSRSSPPILVGYVYQGGSHLPPNTSPDERWVLMADTQDYPQLGRMIFDKEMGDILFQLPEAIEDPLYMTYVEKGFIVNTLHNGKPVMYRYGDGTVIELSDIGNGHYFDILPDGSVLYSVASSPTGSDIYRYFPQDDMRLMLITDVRNIQTIDITLSSN